MKIEEIEQNSFEDLRGGEELHRKKFFMPKKIEEYHHHNFEEDEIRICVNHSLFIALSFLTGTKYG